MKDIKIYLNFSKTSELNYLIGFFESLTNDDISFTTVTLDIIDREKPILDQIIEKMLFCDIVISSINESEQPGIFYEMGIAQGLGIPHILITTGIVILPLELQELNCIYYNPENRKTLTDQLETFIFQFPKDKKNFSAFAPKPVKHVQKKVFVSYSHKDSEYLERLKVHIKPLEKVNLMELWSDTKIKVGEKWKVEIDNALKNSVIAILLVSADFMASDFIVNNELPPLLKAAEDDGVLIIPVVVKPCRFMRDKNLAQFQSINDPKNPLCKLTEFEQEEIYEQLTQRIESVLDSMH